MSLNVYSGNSLPQVYLYAYCEMYDIHCITHAILLIFVLLSTVNNNNCSFNTCSPIK